MANKACRFLARQGATSTLCKAIRSPVTPTVTGTDIAVSMTRGNLKYPVGSFSINRYLHTMPPLCACSKRFSTAVDLKCSPNSDDVSRGADQLVTDALQTQDLGRLFAIVQVAGKQRKVTTEDVIIVEADFPPSVGDRIRLEKVLMVGGRDFSLFGKPMLSRQQVSVEATVVEKTLSHFQVNFWYKKRKRYSKFKLKRNQQTMLLINSIEVNRNMDL